MFFHKFSPVCVYVVMILSSAKQSSVHVTNEYSELAVKQTGCQETEKFLLKLYHSAVVTLHILSKIKKGYGFLKKKNHLGVEDSILLGCDIVLLSEWFLIERLYHFHFQGSNSPSHISWIVEPSEMKVPPSFEVWGTAHPSPHHHVTHPTPVSHHSPNTTSHHSPNTAGSHSPLTQHHITSLTPFILTPEHHLTYTTHPYTRTSHQTHHFPNTTASHPRLPEFSAAPL